MESYTTSPCTHYLVKNDSESLFWGATYPSMDAAKKAVEAGGIAHCNYSIWAAQCVSATMKPTKFNWTK